MPDAPEPATAMHARLAALPGIAGVTVIDAAGEPAASSGEADPRRDAVLTAFLATRVRAITAEGDLRGKGRQLAESRLRSATATGRTREYLVVPAGPLTAFATVRAGAYADIVLEDALAALEAP